MTPPRPASPCNTPRSPLHLAAENGYADAITTLLGGGADVNDVEKNGVRPLHYAALGGYVEVVKLLLKAGADVNKLSKNKRAWARFAGGVHAGAGARRGASVRAAACSHGCTQKVCSCHLRVAQRVLLFCSTVCCSFAPRVADGWSESSDVASCGRGAVVGSSAGAKLVGGTSALSRRYTASVALPTRAPAGPFYTHTPVPLGAIGL